MRLASLMSGALFAVLTNACSGTFVDGYDAAYVEAPPVGIEYYPRYPFHDGYVYEAHGRYYHEHHGRWAVYDHAPAEIRGRRPYVREPRGRAEHQR